LQGGGAAPKTSGFCRSDFSPTQSPALSTASYLVALADLIVELVQHGFDFYFSEPLRQADAGFVINKTADVGLSATQKMMAPVIRNVIAKLDDEQLRTICVFMQQIMAPEIEGN
jgi:hypothetical protein